MNNRAKNLCVYLFGVRCSKTGLNTCISVFYGQKLPNKTEQMIYNLLIISTVKVGLPNTFCSDRRTKSVRLSKLQNIDYQSVKYWFVRFCSVERGNKKPFTANRATKTGFLGERTPNNNTQTERREK